MKYKLKHKMVEAHHYVLGQIFVDLPPWARDYELPNGADMARLHIEPFQKRIWVPTRSGHTFAQLGDWLTFDGETIRVLSNSLFEKSYEPVETIGDFQPI